MPLEVTHPHLYCLSTTVLPLRAPFLRRETALLGHPAPGGVNSPLTRGAHTLVVLHLTVEVLVVSARHTRAVAQADVAATVRTLK